MVEITANKVNQWLNNPNQIGEEHIDGLKDFIAKHPYYAPTQAILAKAYYNADNPGYAGQLKLASLYINDRVWLYHFIHQAKPLIDDSKQTLVSKKEDNEIAETPEFEKVLMPENDCSSLVDENQKAIAEKVSANGEEENNLTLNKLSSQEKEVEALSSSKITLIQGDGGVISTPNIGEEELVAIAPKLKQAIIEPTHLEEVSKAYKKSADNPEVAEKPLQIAEDLRTNLHYSAENVNDLPITVNDKKEGPAHLQNNTQDIPQTEAELLSTEVDSVNTENNDNSLDLESDKGSANKLILENCTFLDWLDYATFDAEPSPKHQVEEKTMLAETSNVEKASDLLIQFLANKPKPGEIKITHYRPEEKSVESDSASYIPISETLAQVYLKQEEAEMAKDIYKKLALKYPEKKTYFAALIKILENKS